MILKTASLLYLFDFDGTVAGSDDWLGFVKNFQISFKQLHCDPGQFDIRWCILTSRPRIDRMLIKAVCGYHHLNPEKIITSPTWFWYFKNVKQEAAFKAGLIKSILEGSFNIGYTDRKITKVCYIDNNYIMNKEMNELKEDYRYLAMSVADFVHRDYLQLLAGGR